MKIGDLVFIIENCPAGEIPIGQVGDIYPGERWICVELISGYELLISRSFVQTLHTKKQMKGRKYAKNSQL